MSDAEIQRLQRAWGASPADQQLLSRLIAAHRRVGDVPPPALLDAQLTPAAMVRSESSVRRALPFRESPPRPWKFQHSVRSVRQNLGN